MVDDKDLLRTVGEAVREARQKAGLRQGELADMVYVTQTSVSKLERGLQEVRLDAVLAIFQTCGCPVYAGERQVVRARDVWGVIASEMVRRNISLRGFAELCGISEGTMWQWQHEKIGHAKISNVMRALQGLGQPLSVRTR